MNIDSFVMIFKGECYNSEMFKDLSINGLSKVRENIWEHKKTKTLYVFTISVSNIVLRVEKLIDNRLILLTNASKEEKEEKENSRKNKLNCKTDFYKVMQLIIGSEPIGPGTFFNAFNKIHRLYPELYKGYTSSNGITIDKKKCFDWFVENCPKNENGKFSKLIRFRGKEINMEQADNMLRGNDGNYYYLKPYDLSIKHDINYFIRVFNNIVKYKKLFDSI